jgi:hypothetical protein
MRKIIFAFGVFLTFAASPAAAQCGCGGFQPWPSGWGNAGYDADGYGQSAAVTVIAQPGFGGGWGGGWDGRPWGWRGGYGWRGGGWGWHRRVVW